MCVFACVSAFTCVCLYLCWCVCVCVCFYMCVYACVCFYMCVYVCVCMCVQSTAKPIRPGQHPLSSPTFHALRDGLYNNNHYQTSI